MRQRFVQDVSELPTHAFGPRMTMWWGTLGFCALEGMGMALAAGAYLYLAWINQQWPLNAEPPDHLWSAIVTVMLIASVLPNSVASKYAKRHDLAKVRLALVIMSAIGIALAVLRVLEFGTLNVSWDDNAYGSIVWVLLGFHTAHLLTDVGDTLVLTALMFTRHAKGKRFSDVEDNAFYWLFVIFAWLPVYVLIYWAPRL